MKSFALFMKTTTFDAVSTSFRASQDISRRGVERAGESTLGSISEENGEAKSNEKIHSAVFHPPPAVTGYRRVQMTRLDCTQTVDSKWDVEALEEYLNGLMDKMMYGESLTYFQRPVHLMIDQEPFAEGECREAYYMKELHSEEPSSVLQVIKNDKNKGRTSAQSQKAAQRSVETQLLCQVIAALFNSRVPPHYNLLFTQVDVLMDTTASPTQAWCSEPYLAGEFLKYNSNFGWVTEATSTAATACQALSHFSWQKTKTQVLLVDLQGVGSVLTDPAAHTAFPSADVGTDLGSEGMRRFFESHHCNHLCEMLELSKHPDQE